MALQRGEAVDRVSTIADLQFRGGSKAVHVTLRQIRGFPPTLNDLRASRFRFPWQSNPLCEIGRSAASTHASG